MRVLAALGKAFLVWLLVGVLSIPLQWFFFKDTMKLVDFEWGKIVIASIAFSCGVIAVLLVTVLKRSARGELWIALPILMMGVVYVGSYVCYEEIGRPKFCSLIDSKMREAKAMADEKYSTVLDKIWQQTCSVERMNDPLYAIYPLKNLLGAIVSILGFLMTVGLCRYWDSEQLSLKAHLLVYSSLVFAYMVWLRLAGIFVIINTLQIITLNDIALRVGHFAGFDWVLFIMAIEGGLALLLLARLYLFFYRERQNQERGV